MVTSRHLARKSNARFTRAGKAVTGFVPAKTTRINPTGSETVTNTLDKLIRQARLERGLTQDELAKATKTTVSRISRIERGSELLGFPKSALLARALKLEHREVVAAILKSLVRRSGLKYDVKLEASSRRREPRAGEEVPPRRQQGEQGRREQVQGDFRGVCGSS